MRSGTSLNPSCIQRSLTVLRALTRARHLTLRKCLKEAPGDAATTTGEEGRRRDPDYVIGRLAVVTTGVVVESAEGSTEGADADRTNLQRREPTTPRGPRSIRQPLLMRQAVPELTIHESKGVGRNRNLESRAGDVVRWR